MKNAFQIKLIEKIKPSISKNISDRDDDEKRLWQILDRTVNINSIFNSLEIVTNYLNIEDRKTICDMIGVDYSIDYFKYHMENYIIRIASLPDALAWLANDVLGWGYTKNLYGTTLKSINACPQSLKDKMNILLDKIKDIRAKRHIKIHEGEVELPYFSDIVFYSELPIDDVPDILIELTEEDVNKQISSLKKEISDIEKMTGDFMGELINSI